jgi:uncharacterized coiled-coil protein SlyX
MVETRVITLEQKVSDLNATVAAQTVKIEHLVDTVAALQKQLEPLTESVNKGKGALTMAIILAGTFGALIDTAVRRLFID